MRGFVAKFFRREAVREMIGDGVPRRDLVQKNTGEVVNSPNSVRSMFLQLKRAYKRQRAGLAAIWSYATARRQGLIKPIKQRGHGKKAAAQTQPQDRIVTIQKPLMLILQHCQPSQNERGEWDPHPVYQSARRAADRGRGDLVQKMARQFLPA